jgi:hypothetical protein
MDRNGILTALRDYKNHNSTRYGITALGLFGSVARGQFNDESDVDIFVRTVTPNPFCLAHIKEEIEQIVHRRVDIVRVRDRMNPFLKARIEKEGINV